MGEDRDDFLEELDDDAESSVPELEVAPESQPEEEDGPVKEWLISSQAAFSASPWLTFRHNPSINLTF